MGLPKSVGGALNDDDEQRLLRSVLHQNAESIFLARQRAERELELAKEALEVRTRELAESLALTQATLEATADGILATDDRGRITSFNENFLAIWEIPRPVAAGSDQRALFDLMSSQASDTSVFCARLDALLEGDPEQSFDVVELADGRVIERYTRVQRTGERVIGRVWSFRDVTERARAEANLRAAKALADAANRAKSTFLAMMSHELRTPLNAIAGYAELMQLGIHGPVTAEQQHALERIQGGQRHLLGLIDEVLMHAKLETGNVAYQQVAVVAGDAVRNAEALVAPQAWSKGVRVSAREPGGRIVMRADPEKVQQILLNLLSNAVKFTASGGLVEVASVGGTDTVRISVRDTGIGIAPEMADRIFEPFVQVRSELTRSAEGAGLGLAISRALARGMGGDLVVVSEPGRGSVFTLSLPAMASGADLASEVAEPG
jgi:PAS domain S-box-containing protein